MICLTGDIHHKIGNPVQSFYQGSEAQLALEYLKISQKFNLKTTLFITGKAFVENWSDIKKLLTFDNLEIGGHTWSAFRPFLLHQFFKKFTGSLYGPKWYQKHDIQKALAVIKQKTGKKVVSWRTHAYCSNQNTWKILVKNKVKVISDEVTPTKIKPHKLENLKLISLPINILPDHEHIYYGTPERIALQMKGKIKDAFTNKSFPIDKYGQIVISQIKEIQRKNGVATLLLHPQTMKLTDNFKTFYKICQFIAQNKYKTIWAKESINYL